MSPAVEELDRYVLVIQESPSGHVTHSWRAIEAFDLSQFRIQPHAERTYGRIMLAAARERDCDQENLLCFRRCMRARIPSHLGHIKPPRRGDGAKAEICQQECRPSYEDCLKAQGLRLQEFSAVDGAIDWLRQNRNGVILGGIVVIAGVAFWVFPPTAIAGATLATAKALFVLVPVAALASSEVACEPHTVAVVP
ncbi:hypothetical protein [Vitiosangium sp. GDMCC 1.1324]|uniref:hypothetical protein n=1 Tax=Vitiosangium sp. (strain GDMCC 1.1324) TaxID=2138576 RepID=UPI0011B3E006|nr:hypothetical protein [Vitiosangium sp. GDMCC 1.1324]